MSFLLILFLLYQLNQPAASVPILNSDSINLVIATNNLLYKILQLCSINNLKTISVIQGRNPITPFIPYAKHLSNTFVYYNYDAHSTIETDFQTYSNNFKFIILYGDPMNETRVFDSIKSLTDVQKLILVTFETEDCSENTGIYYMLAVLQKDNIIQICKEPNTELRVWSGSMNIMWAPEPWRLSVVSAGLFIYTRKIDENINACNSVFYLSKQLTRHYPTVKHMAIRTIVIKLYPPLMTFNNDGTVEEWKSCFYRKCNEKNIKTFRVAPDNWGLFGGYDGEVLGTIFSRLHVWMSVIVYLEVSVDNNSLTEWKEMENRLDWDATIHLNSRDLTYITRNRTFVYPSVQREIRVVTQSRGVVAVPARIGDIFNVEIIISAAIIYSLFMLALRTVDGRDFGCAALDAFSLILGLSIPKLPNSLATRIFFGSLILYFMIICTHFQGNVTEIMTVPLAAASVDSLDDLDASGYTVYAGFSTYDNFESFRKRFHNFAEHNGEHCVELVLNDPNAACIDEAEYLYHQMLKNTNLHLVKEPFRTFYATYLVHKSWLLKNRFEILFGRLSEGGILHKWQKDIENLARIKAQIWESSAEYKSLMTLENFKIFFILLYAGLLICTVIWIAEILYSIENLIQSLTNGWNNFILRIYFYFRRVRQFLHV